MLAAIRLDLYNWNFFYRKAFCFNLRKSMAPECMQHCRHLPDNPLAGSKSIFCPSRKNKNLHGMSKEEAFLVWADHGCTAHEEFSVSNASQAFNWSYTRERIGYSFQNHFHWIQTSSTKKVSKFVLSRELARGGLLCVHSSSKARVLASKDRSKSSFPSANDSLQIQSTPLQISISPHNSQEAKVVQPPILRSALGSRWCLPHPSCDFLQHKSVQSRSHAYQWLSNMFTMHYMCLFKPSKPCNHGSQVSACSKFLENKTISWIWSSAERDLRVRANGSHA